MRSIEQNSDDGPELSNGISHTWNQPRIIRWLVLLLLAVALGPGAMAAEMPPGTRLTTHRLPPVQLRGYGRVAAKRWELPGGASVLRVECEDAARAKVLQAKYLSDLYELPGIQQITLASGTVAYVVQGQGAIAAIQEGARVFLFTASSPVLLSRAISSEMVSVAINNSPLAAGPLTPNDGGRQAASRFRAALSAGSATGISSKASVPVPTYLDRWDKFGFRFYYRPWALPTGQEERTYEVAREFDFAAQQGGSGLVFWDDENRLDTAEGLMNEVWFDWAQAAAKARDLPVAINDSGGMGATPTWLLNRYREQTQGKMPGYVGDFYTVDSQDNGGQGSLSWNATTAEDVELGLLQSSVRRFTKDPNVVSWLEPHGELNHGLHDIFLEYGPVADEGYRRYLRQTYGTLAALGQRWYGNGAVLHSWDQVRVPEVAAFAGWGPGAMDLSGDWRVSYERRPGGGDYTADELRAFGSKPVPVDAPPAEWLTPGFDDSSWPIITAPGNDRTLFLPRRPAIYRRKFEVPAAWAAAHPRNWIYVWDLNQTWGAPVRAFLNGQPIGESLIQHPRPHWAAYASTAALHPGSNLLALDLPQGYLAYRVYLSEEPPTQYPNLGPGLNAQWVDFVDWNTAARVDSVRRGMEMIRQVDPERPITLMHPDEYADGVKKYAEAFGGEFHNTGYMGAFYSDYDPLLMQGSGLPFSLEPGGPPDTLAGYRKMMGLYYSEGTQGLDYFIHIGDVLWNAAIRKEFEATQPLVHLIGKYHAPQADTAVLYSTRIAALTGYPWGNDPNVNLGSGYWRWNLAANLRDHYARDGLSESDFTRGNAARYRVIFDSNTSIMDESLVRQIEQYVRAGGTFVTFGQTGRHTPTEKDSWPISRLTGYKVVRVNKYNPDGQVPGSEWHPLTIAKGQTIFRPDNWNVTIPANGLSLRKVAPDCQDLLLWEDGSAAVGMRPLGKGFIVDIGAKFVHDHLFDRIEPGGNTPDRQALTALLTGILQWRGVQPIPAHLESPDAQRPPFIPPYQGGIKGGLAAGQGPQKASPDADSILMRHWISNNGLYDIWTLWNQDTARGLGADLVFTADLHPRAAIEVVNGSAFPVTATNNSSRLAGIRLGPLETRAFLTPRGRLSAAPLEWLELQRSWWRGTTSPSVHPLPAPPHRFSMDLSEGWDWRPLQEGADPLIAAASTTGWERRRLGIWTFPHHQAIKHALYRRSFKVPAGWKSGAISLWLQSWFSTTFVDRGRIFLDGRLIHDWSADALPGALLRELKPGSTHTLLVEIASDGSLAGSRGDCWLWYRPDPLSSLDLAGDWSSSQDALHYTPGTHLPGDYRAFSLRRTVDLPAMVGKNVVLHVDATGPLLGVLVNGHWVRRHHHRIGGQWDLAITPWLHAGAANELELFCAGGPDHGRIRGLSLDSYVPGDYP